MKFFKDKNILISLTLSGLIALFMVVLWEFSGTIIAAVIELVTPPGTVFTWRKAVVLVFLALLVDFLAEKSSVKRIFPRVICSLLFWFCISFLSAHFLNIGLFFISVFLTVLLTLSIVHLKKMWMIDSELTERRQRVRHSKRRY